MLSELLPRRASYQPGEAIDIEVRGAASGTIVVRHLGDVVHEAVYSGGDIVVPALPAGGYSVELGTPRTAIEVSAEPCSRLRYGFVASYAPDKDVAGLTDTVRRLHLTWVQFYDWAYRHADLMGGGDEYRDALNQPIALATVKALIAAVQAAGSHALGYAAVYAVGPQEWDGWKHRALLQADGSPYALGDFLFILDPAAPDWLEHFTGELVAATQALGFDGFHLDQYGYPKRAVRADGAIVDTGQSFVTMIEAVRHALPAAQLVFNNVNDFPTRRTAASRQDAVYIEPWAPQLTLQALADTVTRARAFGSGKPVLMAAYQHVYETAPAEAADRATALTMATLYSHGATQLLAGEADRLLCDPYYVRNHQMAASTADMLKRWYDFLVAHDELLLDPRITDITDCYAGPYNGDLDVTFADAGVTERAEAGKVWRRITQVGDRIVVHLINLCGQRDTLWDAPRQATSHPGAATLRFKPLHGHTPRVRVADPDGKGHLEEVDAIEVSATASYALPRLNTWQMLVIDLTG